uniref:Uncharacterized protein n=1 Tax=Anguilla anguilla TaxID=7936 RepID=A0A0E9XD49_ANGAN
MEQMIALLKRYNHLKEHRPMFSLGGSRNCINVDIFLVYFV